MVAPYTDDDITRDMEDIFNTKTQEEGEDQSGEEETDLDIQVNAILANMEEINGDGDDDDNASIHEAILSSDDDVDMGEFAARPGIARSGCPGIARIGAQYSPCKLG